MILRLLTNLFRKNNVQRFAAPDPSFGYAEVPAIIALLKQNNFDAVKDFYKSITADKRSALVDAICMTDKHAAALQQWISNRPGCAVANLFNGCLWTYTAWEARTGKRAKEVTEEQANTFFEHLDKAFDYLKTSIGENPQDAEPYARMLRVLMGLSEPLEHLYDYFNEMISLEPEHFWGHMYMLNAASEKWLGSDEEMFTFTNDVISRLKPGSLLYTLVPMAHTEVWLNKVREDTSYNHFLQDGAKKEIHAAYNNSVLSGKLAPSQLLPIVHNYFCFAFHFMGDAKNARIERQKFGNLISFYPWAYEGIYEPKEVDALLGKLEAQNAINTQRFN